MGGKDSIFSFATLGSVSFRPYRRIFVPRWMNLNKKRIVIVTFCFLFAENVLFLQPEKNH